MRVRLCHNIRVAEDSSVELLRGSRRYELSDWLGNVRVVVSDARVPVRQGGVVRGYRGEVVGVREYYSYGGRLVERSYEAGRAYRWGFNGQENDNEVIGKGRWQDYGSRQYRPDIARFIAVDPLARQFAWLTPYNFAGNSPIAFIDLYGLQQALAITMDRDVRYRGDYFVGYKSLGKSKGIRDFTHVPIAQEDAIGGLISALEELSRKDERGIHFLAIFSHGFIKEGNSYIFGMSEENRRTRKSTYMEINVTALSKLREAVQEGRIKFTPCAVIYLGGCYAGRAGWNNKEGISFAQALANATGATVVASINTVAPAEEDPKLPKLSYVTDKIREGVVGGFMKFRSGLQPEYIGQGVNLYNLIPLAPLERLSPRGWGGIELYSTVPLQSIPFAPIESDNANDR